MSLYNAQYAGQTPDNVATISRSLSFYIARDVPTGEIDQIIGWLDSIRADCEFKISQLRSLKRDRDRAEDWRIKINDLARQFYDKDSLHLDLETRTLIIRQRLDVPPHIARSIAENVMKWARRERLKNRDALIRLRYDNGEKAAAIADDMNISRQQVYNVLKSGKRFIS